MNKNIGTFDRIMRTVIGIGCLLVIFFLNVSTVGKIVLVIAAIFSFYQAATSWCFLYQILGKNTCPVK